MRELRILLPDEGEPLVSMEFGLEHGARRYVQALLGGVDQKVLFPGETEPSSVWNAIEQAFNQVLARRVEAPLSDPPEPAAVVPREEHVYADGALIRESLSLTHPNAGGLRALLAKHVRVAGVDPVSPVIFVGRTAKGKHYKDDTLNVYYSGHVKAETLAQFGLTSADIVHYNNTYFGLKVHLSTSATGLRLLDLKVQDYLPLPVPAWVTLVDLRFGIARHFGLNEETADVYFDTWRHDEAADWCKTVGQRPPAPDGALKGIHTYGVTYNRHTKAIGKVKVYKWSKNFVDGIADLHPKATRWMLQKWSKQTLSLT